MQPQPPQAGFVPQRFAGTNVPRPNMAFPGGSGSGAMGLGHQMPVRFPQNFHGNQERTPVRFDMNQSIPFHGRANLSVPPDQFGDSQNLLLLGHCYLLSIYNTLAQLPPFQNMFHSDFSEAGLSATPQIRFPGFPANNGSNGAGVFHLGWLPPTNLERYAVFETMLTCGMKMPGKKYLAIYWLEFRDIAAPLTSPVFENDRSGHAEDYLLEHLTRQLDVVHKERLRSVTILQNASPCSRCAEKYAGTLGHRLVNEHHVHVVLVFSAFHSVRRLSCLRDGHPHQFPCKEIDEENREGLRKLDRTGIMVRTTGFEDWRKLCTALQVPWPWTLQSEYNYRSSPCGQEDDRLRGDLQAVLP